MTRDFIAYCGLYCGACSFRVAVDDADPEHVLRMPAKYDQYKSEPFDRPCPGCKLENLCGRCAIRDCAQEKQINHCGICNEFPCDKVEQFNNDGVPHHGEVVANLTLLQKVGEERWLETQKKRWECSCGRRFSWYHNACPTCTG
jgi:hypothetical protein